MIKFPHCILLFLLLSGIVTSAEKPKVFKEINILINADIASKLKKLETQKVDVVSFFQAYGTAFDEGTTAVLVERPPEFYISSTNDDANNEMVKAVCAWLLEYSPWFTAEMLITGDESVIEARYRSICFAAEAASQKKSN